MNTEDVTEMQIYRPRTAQTKAVYEMLLNRDSLSLHSGLSQIRRFRRDTCAMQVFSSPWEIRRGDLQTHSWVEGQHPVEAPPHIAKRCMRRHNPNPRVERSETQTRPPFLAAEFSASAEAPDVLRGAADEVGFPGEGSQPLPAFGTPRIFFEKGACGQLRAKVQQFLCFLRCWLPLRRRASWTLSARRTVDKVKPLRLHPEGQCRAMYPD